MLELYLRKGSIGLYMGGNGTSAMTERKSRQGIKVYHCKRPARWQSCRSLGHLLKFLQKYMILVYMSNSSQFQKLFYSFRKISAIFNGVNLPQVEFVQRMFEWNMFESF